MSSSEQLSNPGAFLPYPVSTLSPPIAPNDLTSFKSRGLSEVERNLRQKLVELHETYVEAVEQFNWNKLVYEADIRFEPIVGKEYHLYTINNRYLLSMLAPEEWHQPYIGTFRLNVGREWEVVKTDPAVDSKKLFGST